MSVTINWSFTNYSDVEAVLMCRSEVLNSEKAFEDSLNGITQTSFPDIIGSAITSDLTEGLQSFTDLSPLTPSTTYYYCVAAKGLGSDGLFKVGPTSADASSSPVTGSADGGSSVSVVTTAAESGGGGADTTAPQTPTGLFAAAGDGEVIISWNANSETDLAGYNVYRSETSGIGHTLLTPTSSSSDELRDSSVTNGTPYFYKISAEDTTGNESAFSSEVSATPQAAGGGGGSGGGAGAGSAPNIQVTFAFAYLLGAYETLYGEMPPLESGETHSGINFYNDVFDTQLDLVNSWSNKQSIIIDYIASELLTDKYVNTNGHIPHLNLFSTTVPRDAYLRRKSFVNMHYIHKYGVAAATYQQDQGNQRLTDLYDGGTKTDYQAVANYLYLFATDTDDETVNGYVRNAPAAADMATYITTANDIGVAAGAPWSSPT